MIGRGLSMTPTMLGLCEKYSIDSINSWLIAATNFWIIVANTTVH